MRLLGLTSVILACIAPARSQTDQFKTAGAVLENYKHALGGVEAIRKVQSETIRGEVESTGKPVNSTFVYYARPFKSLIKVTRPDGTQVSSGFDGKVSWSVTPQGANIDKDTPIDAIRRDADLQYALHQPDYFKKLELAGVSDFEGRSCYWLHGTTNWGKDNNQFYDVQTGLLAGYRFQSDDSSAAPVTALFQDYRNFGGPLVATKWTTLSGDHTQSFLFKSVSYEPFADSIFELPPAVKALLK